MDTQPTPSNPVSPEAGPAGVRPENLPGGDLVRPAAPEMAPAAGGGGAQPPAATPPALTAADVAAAIAAVPGPTAPGGTPSMPAPTAAGDVDVIEPEWVDKAEQVVKAHEGDPYGEEEAVEDLQQDYLQKRYGHTVKDPDSSKPEGT